MNEPPDGAVAAAHADQLLTAVEAAVRAPYGTTAKDWGTRARGADGDCRVVAEHIAVNLIWYAAVGVSAPDSVRADHPVGMTDAEGLLALGTAETLLHTDDIAAALGVPFDAPPEVCRWVIARLLPDVRVGNGRPWQVLRWATGRGGLPGRVPVAEWSWRIPPSWNAPRA